MQLTHPHMNRRSLLMGLCASASGLHAPVWAQQAWQPQSAVRIVIPLPPGGGPDALNRLLAEVLKKRWGVPVNIENKPGASGAIGLKAVSQQAPADGHHLAYLTSAHITADILSPTLDVLKELEPVSMFSNSPMVLINNAQARHRTLAELVAAAKAAPGKLSYGSGGVGSALHMVMAEFCDKAGIELLHVPYKGGLAATQGLANGEVDVSVQIPSSIKALLPTGRIRLLGSATAQRLGVFPELATVKEQLGFEFNPGSWGGFAVRKGTAPGVVAGLHAALAEAAKDATVADFIQSNGGLLAVSASPKAFDQAIRAQYQVEGELIRRLQIKPE